MRRISPRRRLPQLLQLLLFIGISSTSVATNYTPDESNRTQSLSTSISSPWPPSTRVRNIKGAVPPKTKSTGDLTSRLLVLVADGDTDSTADAGLEEIGKKSGGGGDFRDSRDFKADAFGAPDYNSAATDFKAGEESVFSKPPRENSLEFTLVVSRNFDEKTTNKPEQSNVTSALFQVNGTRKKRDNWYFAAVPNFWTYQPQGYLFYGFGIPMVSIQWPNTMQSPRQVHSPLSNQHLNINDNSMSKDEVDFNDLNYGDDKNLKGKWKFGDKLDYQDDSGHDEYDEHIHLDHKLDDEDAVLKDGEPEIIKTGRYSGAGKWRPLFPNKKLGSVHAETVKKPSPAPKKQKPLAHWLQHVFPPWPKNKTVDGRN